MLLLIHCQEAARACSSSMLVLVLAGVQSAGCRRHHKRASSCGAALPEKTRHCVIAKLCQQTEASQVNQHTYASETNAVMGVHNQGAWRACKPYVTHNV
jgi:hypothetical protein